MKIWYQSMTDLRAFPAYHRALRLLLDRVKDAETVIDLHGMTELGGIGDQYRYLEFLETAEVIRNVHRAIEQKYDAFLIGNILEPGLKIAREVSEFPVLGLGETAAHIGCMMGASISLITINEKFTVRLEETVRLYGLKERFVGAFRMNMPRILDLEGGFLDKKIREQILENFETAAAAADQAGAEVVIPAGGVVMALLAEMGIGTTRSGLPILNGIATLVKMGEAAARLKQLTGAFTSKRNSYAPPPVQQISEMRRAYGGGIYPTIEIDGTPKASDA